MRSCKTEDINIFYVIIGMESIVWIAACKSCVYFCRKAEIRPFVIYNLANNSHTQRRYTNRFIPTRCKQSMGSDETGEYGGVQDYIAMLSSLLRLIKISDGFTFQKNYIRFLLCESYADWPLRKIGLLQTFIVNIQICGGNSPMTISNFWFCPAIHMKFKPMSIYNIICFVNAFYIIDEQGNYA